MKDHPTLDDVLGRGQSTERECQLCHELFLDEYPSTICPRCAHKSIADDDENTP